MRLTLILFALSLAPASLASADCGPGSPPDCTCIVNISEEMGFRLQGGLIEYLPVNPIAHTAGTLVVNSNNNFGGQTSLLSNVSAVNIPTVVPEIYYHVPVYSAEPIYTVTTLAPTVNLPLYTPIVNPRIQTHSSGSSSGVLSFSMYNSGGATSRAENFDPLSIDSVSSELTIPEPTSLALFVVSFIAVAAARRPSVRR